MSETVQRYCIDCGNPIPADGNFCTECGLQVGALPASPHVGTVGTTTVPRYPFGCQSCGGNGIDLSFDAVYCPECRWLRPLHPDYRLPEDAFMWQLDAQAMSVLNSSGPLASAAHGIAERYGRPVFEAATNGIRLSERQLPEIFELAVRAARLMNLPMLPEVYISGDRMWDVYSLGGYGGSFVSIGSVLINLKSEELLFLIAREMGHVRAGHVFWKTAMQFLMGQQKSQATVLGEGVLQFLNPAKLLETAVEMPLMRWARHSEITADRAALLVCGELGRARQVLTQWAMKSFPIYGKLNQDAWLEQEMASGDPHLRLSESTMSTTPYLAPRLRTLAEFSDSEAFAQWRQYIDHYAEGAGVGPPTPATVKATTNSTPGSAPRSPPALSPDKTRLPCPACGKNMVVPKSLLASNKSVNVRCPEPECRKVSRIKPQSSTVTTPPSTSETSSSGASKPEPDIVQQRPQRARIVCVSCKEPMFVDKSALGSNEPVNVRCPNLACGEVLLIKPRKRKEPPPDQTGY